MAHLLRYILLIIISMLPLHGIWYDICIDPGHCGEADPGAPGVNGSAEPDESDFNLDIAQKCYEDLVYNYGWSVLLTRDDEYHFPKFGPYRKALIANGKATNDNGEWTVFPVSRAVSIHCNSSTDPTAHGTETYYWNNNPRSHDFAYNIHFCVWNYLQMFPYANNRGVKQKNFWFLKDCDMPACLVEVAFVSHYVSPDHGQWYQLRYNQGGFKDYAAYGIDDGILGTWEIRESPSYFRPEFLPWMPLRGSVNILWHPIETQGVTYSIYRRVHPSPDYVLIASGISDTTYTDNNVSGDKTYSYYALAENGSQTSPPSNILTIRTPNFTSDYTRATGINNGTKITFDNNGISHLTYTSDTAFWYARSSDYGNIWSISQLVEWGYSPCIMLDSQENPHIIGFGCAGFPDTASGEDTSYVIFYSQYLDSIWKSPYLYETSDSILSVSFAIDPLDTGWVLFNTLDDAGNNRLKIGQFYTQEMPESLENVITLDTYTGTGIGAIGVKTSDRSLHIVYEKGGGDIMYLNRDEYGNWSTPFRITVGHNPSISIAGDLIHFVWERWYPRFPPTRIQTCYTDGKYWSRIQDIASHIAAKGCYPYMENGSIVTWQATSFKQWDVYSSRRTESGAWTIPENISQTPDDSKYPQVAMHQSISSTKLVYVWTEGNSSPYEIKIKPVSLRSNLLPLYAFDLGQEKPSVFLKHRTGYIIYGSGFARSVDYDTSFLHYRITGFNPHRLYQLGLVFYQDESNEEWQQQVVIDGVLMKRVEVPRRRVVFEKVMIDKGLYQDGVVDLVIKREPGVVCAGLVVWEFIDEDRNEISVKEFNSNTLEEFDAYAIPNPAKRSVRFYCRLPVPGEIRVKIYTATGRLVRKIGGYKAAGLQRIIWDGKDSSGRDISTGIYFYRAELMDRVKTGKLILLR